MRGVGVGDTAAELPDQLWHLPPPICYIIKVKVFVAEVIVHWNFLLLTAKGNMTESQT